MNGPRTPVKFDVPKGACDTHVHVYLDPEKYPFSPNRVYTPPVATEADLSDLQDYLGFNRLVVVQPSNYGTDNSATLQGVKYFGPDRARAVVVIDDKTSNEALDEMHEIGARGVRVNLELDGVSDPIEAGHRLWAMAERLKPRGWHVQTYTRLRILDAVKEQLAALPVPIVFDHFAGAQAEGGVDQPGFKAVLDLVRSGKAYVKISAAYRSSKSPGYSDLTPVAQALIAANPDRILWGSDWPHPDGSRGKPFEISPFYPIDDGLVLNLLETWAPDSDVRQQILVDNPGRLFGF